MKHLRLVKKIKTVDPDAYNAFYENCIVEKIRAKYSINEELAILRQRDTKPAEFAEYNAYVESCKADVKAELDEI